VRYDPVLVRDGKAPSDVEARQLRDGLRALAEVLVDAYVASRRLDTPRKSKIRESVPSCGGSDSCTSSRSGEVDWDSLAVLETLDERAGIMEYDGGMSRDEAERLALAEIAAKRMN
jgi:hypothetical protein